MSVRTLLLVEDNLADVLLMREVLADVAPDVHLDVVRDGADALLQLREGRVPDLVLLDVNMPRVTGLQVLEALRADPAFTSARVVVWSTSGAPMDVRAAQERGAQTYVEKPATYDGLRLLIAGLVAGEGVESPS
ncbi:response regulator [Deinococcus maricopensis]|uniref:Response regulator receiver n=1 Tax=Deinococcus maricopensis (strain DSM 21211 / LMG 22137 / NRRL B-23946 / LB-34) TaxID=709986 RepID=E8U3C5_DEIML|nr:response regulator [Deinococcus maricopensis]ADV65796.1 response regulator receiver [Deinococcus maricopensis DSM 21211]